MTPKTPQRTSLRRLYSHGGCATCKTRHLKCDQTKPHCERCKLAGWSCQYVDTSIKRCKTPRTRSPPNALSLGIYQPSATAFDSPSEHESWKCFQHVLAHDTFAVFESDSLCELILRVGQYEPAVQRSTIALGGLCQMKLGPGGSRRTLTEAAVGQLSHDAPMDFWFHQYTKAVGLLAHGLMIGQSSQQSALVACLLFIWIELLQQHVDAALQHLLAGLKILRSLQISQKMHTIAPCVRRAFTRLNAQARLHGSPTSHFNKDAPDMHADDLGELPGLFQDIAEAKTYLDIISESSYRAMRQIKLVTGHSKVASSDHHGQYELGKKIEMAKFSLQKWKIRFADLQRRLSKPAYRTPTLALASLELQFTRLYIGLQGVSGTSEMLYDEHTALFERILFLSETILNHSSVTVAQRFFDPRLIPALFLVALKCRKVGLRDKAIELLSRAPEQEGMWRRDNALAIARWKIETEKLNSQDHEGDVIPEDARVHCERAISTMVNGRLVTIRKFVKGETDFENECEWEEAILEPLSDMGDLI